MSDAARRGLFIFLAALLIIIGGVVYEQYRLGGAENATPAVGGPFALVDQNGVARRDTDFRGKVMLIYFGYTYCPDACPTTLQAITNTLDLLGKDAAKVQPLFISVDPARDTQEQLRAYAANFHSGILYLTGAPEELKKVEREFHVYVAKVPQSGSDDYLIDHSSIIYVMGSDGRYLGQMPTGLPPKVMAATVERYL
ncbi:MAG TPA: SCO family protein [Stellaceae bacterium]|nr:SCO family protein [Stellaceae bacterium]